MQGPGGGACNRRQTPHGDGHVLGGRCWNGQPPPNHMSLEQHQICGHRVGGMGG